MPPQVAAKIRMGSALHADRPDICFVDHSHISPQHFFRLAVLPEKRENIISALSLQQCFYFLAHLEFLSAKFSASYFLHFGVTFSRFLDTLQNAVYLLDVLLIGACLI